MRKQHEPHDPPLLQTYSRYDMMPFTRAWMAWGLGVRSPAFILSTTAAFQDCKCGNTVAQTDRSLAMTSSAAVCSIAMEEV